MSKANLFAIAAALLASSIASYGESFRFDLLVVQMPQASGLRMRARLKNEKTVGAAVDELNEMVLTGNATLIDALVGWSKSGERSVSESLEEIRYPTDFNFPGVPSFPPPPPPEKDYLIDSYAKFEL